MTKNCCSRVKVIEGKRRAGLAAVLELLGCHVSWPTSADDALGMLQQGHEFDVVLSDVQMPGAYHECVVYRLRKAGNHA